MTDKERRRERAMALGVGTDVLTATPMLTIALWSHSLTLLADALRGGLLTLLELFAYIMLRRIHRRRLPSYEYGAGKIESFLNLVIGAALVLSSIWVFALGVLNLLHPPPAQPLGLAGATAIAAVNAGQNTWMFRTFLRAGRDHGSVLIDGQVRTRLLKLVSSIVATFAILISAIFSGHLLGVLADLAGSAVVTQVMIWTAYQLIGRSLPDLLDRTLDEPQHAAINSALIHHFNGFDLIHHVRTRRSGIRMFVEIGLGFHAERRMGEVDSVSQSVRREVETLIPGASVTVVATAWRPDPLETGVSPPGDR
jgi:cation diffusion facilitator family transporter